MKEEKSRSKSKKSKKEKKSKSKGRGSSGATGVGGSKGGWDSGSDNKKKPKKFLDDIKKAIVNNVIYS